MQKEAYNVSSVAAVDHTEDLTEDGLRRDSEGWVE